MFYVRLELIVYIQTQTRRDRIEEVQLLFLYIAVPSSNLKIYRGTLVPRLNLNICSCFEKNSQKIKGQYTFDIKAST